MEAAAARVESKRQARIDALKRELVSSRCVDRDAVIRALELLGAGDASQHSGARKARSSKPTHAEKRG